MAAPAASSGPPAHARPPSPPASPATSSGTGPAVPAEAVPHDRDVLVHARTSAVSGLVFAALFVAALVLVRQAPGLGAADSTYTDFYRNTNGNVLVAAGLYVVPFAGVAFLWHMSTTRSLLGALPGSSPGRHAGCTWPRACSSSACCSPAPRR